MYLLVGATYGVAGVRPYYAVMTTATLAVALCGGGLALVGSHRRVRPVCEYAIGAIALLSVVWLTYGWGAGPYYRGPALARLTSVAATPMASPAAAADQAREGFLNTGGDTNMVWHPRTDRPTLGDRLEATGRGLAAECVPIVVLKQLGLVRFVGGRGLLPIADAATVFFDVTAVSILVLVCRRRQAIGAQWPLLVFGFGLSALSAVLLGYVVTNFGTLIRLRSLVEVPLWLVPLAVIPQRLINEGGLASALRSGSLAAFKVTETRRRAVTYHGLTSGRSFRIRRARRRRICARLDCDD